MYEYLRLTCVSKKKIEFLTRVTGNQVPTEDANNRTTTRANKNEEQGKMILMIQDAVPTEQERSGR
jgi:hypothetical protein